MASMFAKAIVVGGALMYAEENLLSKLAPEIYNFVSSTSSIMNHCNIPKAYGFVVLVNLIFGSLFMLTLGFKVGAARKKFMEKAQKDGEKDADKRYALPNMYVDGNSENARLFNCVQRGHQQALETLPQFFLLSVIGGIRFPLFTSLCGLLWMFARSKWAEGYATGKPENRYSHFASYGVWYALIGCLLASCATTVGIFGII